jgi:hypothetical protein
MIDYVPWRCLHCDRVLGMVVRNSNRLPVLHVFDRPQRTMNTELEIKSKLIIGEVFCVCGRIRKWKSGSDERYIIED